MATGGTADARRDEALLLLFERRWLQIDCVARLAMTSTALCAFTRRHRLRRRALALHGFPTEMRLRCWLRETRVAELAAKAASSMEEDGQMDRGKGSIYLSLLEIGSEEEATSLISTGIEGEISRDVDRTFPMHKFFAHSGGDGQRQLANVLKAVSLHAPDVGYCQGMNYVVAALLMLFTTTSTSSDQPRQEMAPQEASFWVVVGLVRQFGLDDLWRPKMPGLSRCIHLYQQLLRRHFYDLHTHLKKIGMHPSLLVTQWFATLFARVLSLDVLARVWDLVLVDGWKMVYRIALAITEHVRPHIINLDMEACSEYFRKHPRLELDSLSADALLSKAFSYKITRKMLVQLDEERHLEYLRLRLQKAPLSHEDSILFPMLEDDGSTLKQKESLDFIRSRLNQFDADTAIDMNVLRKKIEIIDRTNAQATSVLTQKSYALSEVTFALAEHTSAQRRLRRKFDKLLTKAISEASSPRSSAISKAQARLDAYRLWTIPSATMAYMQQSLAGCFERAARLPAAVVSRQSSSSSLGASPSSQSTVSLEEEEEEEIVEETRRNIAHLELLVPHHATKLHVLFRKVTTVERELRRVTRKYKVLQRDTQLAQVDLEEAQQFKDSLADQMLQLMLATERQKNATMQQLFAQVDDAHTAATEKPQTPQTPQKPEKPEKPQTPQQQETEHDEGI